MRRKVIAGNWKMNKSPVDVAAFMAKFPELVKDTENDVILCVPFIDVWMALELTEGTNIKVGVQNMHFKDSGAYTGEISPKMLRDIGIEYVIIGHSERRQYYAETDASCNRKMLAMQEANLIPIYCVGETLAQFEANETKKVVKTQLVDGLKDLSAEFVSKMIIAYEPVWSIGTGKNASKEIAQGAC